MSFCIYQINNIMETLFFNYFPEFLVHGLVFVGFTGIIISFFVETIYTAAARLLCLAVLMFGIYMEGIISFRNFHDSQVKDYEHKVALAEAKAAEAAGKVEIVYKDRVKVVKETQVVVQEKIKDIAIEIDDKCEITPSSIQVLNAMARNNPFIISNRPLPEEASTESEEQP